MPPDPPKSSRLWRFRNCIGHQKSLALQEFCCQYNVDETACKSYVEHLEFLDAKAKKRVRKRNALPSNIAWKMKQIWKRLRTTSWKWFRWRELIRWRVIWSTFCAWGRHPTRKLGMREPMRGRKQEMGGVNFDIISRWGEFKLSFT